MVDLVIFVCVEEQYLVGVGYCIVCIDVVYVGIVVGKYQMCVVGMFDCIFVLVVVCVYYVVQFDYWCVEQCVDLEIGMCCGYVVIMVNVEW